MKVSIAKLSSLIRQKFRHYGKFALVLLMSLSLALFLNPYIAKALDLSDLFRILPSAVQIIQLSSIGDDDEIQLGRQIDAQIKQEVRISQDRSANALVKRLGQMLVASSDRPNIPYTFQVVDDNNLNAFATMGGFVYINTGTIAASDNVAQLASVIGHEMGHIAGRHALEQMKQMAIAQGVATIAGVADDQLVNIGVNLALRLPNSREAEFDADRRGLVNITRAGFAARAMPAFMQKLASSSNSGNAPAFLSTHPATGDRINAINQTIQANNFNTSGGLNDTEYQRIWRSRFR
ncbi:M48 family metalloprotease [Pseudanabaena sp. FACHB-1998]|uniref:M48 family metallopeptidase n=1 Tax=Pseudanabaena sp. FACHB-1998 TaxID=2692858 RepID=UPI0016803C84|nr:M48 family metallopeptidase [Pseudanabaena sp. FACHB-1998]MBD2178126.1 M48 family metalloprotease [Pseudanabaena sp. FACHB-1998]